MATVTVPKSVIIVGGSLSGLMHALVLQSLPTPPKIRILERSPTNLMHSQGAGVVAFDETQQFFQEYVKPGREIAVTSRLRHYLDKKGDVIPESVDKREQRMTSWDLLFHLLRWRVDDMASDYVADLQQDGRPRASYENGCTITNVQDESEGVRVAWNDHDGKEHTEVADLVIAADGASSAIRRTLRPDVERQYAGYVAWRGTVPETELSESASEAFSGNFTFYHNTGVQILAYLVPGQHGRMGKEDRLLNWVWYCNYEEGSPELNDLMTDTDGRRHRITLPVGKLKPDIWEKQKQYSTEILPPQYAELVRKTKQPFVQAITDVLCDQNSFFDGKLLLVGDALAGFRPHTAASTAQAAYDAMSLSQLMKAEITKEAYDEQVLQYASQTLKHGIMLGQRSQFGSHPFAGR